MTADSLGRKPPSSVLPSRLFFSAESICSFVTLFCFPSWDFSCSSRFIFWSPCCSPFTFLSCSPTDIRIRAAALCNTLGLTATIFTPFLVVFLFRTYGVKAVVILILVVQILVVHFYGIEPRMRRLKEIQ